MMVQEKQTLAAIMCVCAYVGTLARKCSFVYSFINSIHITYMPGTKLGSGNKKDE